MARWNYDWIVGAWSDREGGSIQATGGGFGIFSLIDSFDLDKYHDEALVERVVGQFAIHKVTADPGATVRGDMVHSRLVVGYEDDDGGGVLRSLSLVDQINAEEQFLWHRVQEVPLSVSSNLSSAGSQSTNPAWGSIDSRVNRKLELNDALLLRFEPISVLPTDVWEVHAWIRVLVKFR